MLQTLNLLHLLQIRKNGQSKVQNFASEIDIKNEIKFLCLLFKNNIKLLLYWHQWFYKISSFYKKFKDHCLSVPPYILPAAVSISLTHTHMRAPTSCIIVQCLWSEDKVMRLTLRQKICFVSIFYSFLMHSHSHISTQHDILNI